MHEQQVQASLGQVLRLIRIRQDVLIKLSIRFAASLWSGLKTMHGQESQQAATLLKYTCKQQAPSACANIICTLSTGCLLLFLAAEQHHRQAGVRTVAGDGKDEAVASHLQLPDWTCEGGQHT